MDFTAIINNLTGLISDFVHANPIIALAALLIIAYLIYRKPLFFIFIFILALILVGILYLILSMSSPGISQKEKLIKKGMEPENCFRLPGMIL